MASDTELEPCPLCDGPAEVHRSKCGGGFVKCKDYNCGCSTAWFADVQKAVDRWNNRVGDLSIPINSYQTNRVGNAAAMREALVGLSQAVQDFMANKGRNFYPDMAIALEAAAAALAAPPRVCDVNTLESLSDFVEKTILTSDLLKDTHEIVKSIVVASVRTALTIAYEPCQEEMKAKEGVAK